MCYTVRFSMSDSNMKQNQPLTDEEPKPGAAGDNPEPASENAGTGGEGAPGEVLRKESAPEASAPRSLRYVFV